MGNSQAKGAGALSAATEEQPHWDSLAPELLGRILALAGKDVGPAVTQVCKSWRSAWFDEAALQREFNLHAPFVPLAPGQQYTDWPSPAQRATAAATLEGRKLLLQRVGHLVTVLHVFGSPEVSGSLASCLELLPAEPLAEVRLGSGHFSEEWMARLRRFPRLRTLALATSDGGQWTPGACVALRALCDRLQALHVAGQGGRADPAQQALLSLTRLTSLQIQLLAGPTSYLHLTRLSTLRHLTLCASAPPAAPVPPLAAFPALDRCLLGRIGQSRGWTFQLGGEPDLRLRGCLWDRPTGALEVSGFSASSMAHLGRLLAAVTPPRKALASLALDGCQLSFAATHSPLPSALAHLTALHLRCCGAGAAGMDVALQGLLAGCSGLRLRRLVVRSCSLIDLPAVECLPGLEALELSSNHLLCLPPALAAATNLTSLCLDHNRIELAPQDSQPWGPLVRLWRLSHLSLAGNRLRHLPPGAFLPALTYLDLDSNRGLEAPPPSLSAATSLRCLALSGPLDRPRPVLSVADVHLLLPHLLALEDLHIGKLARLAGLAAACASPGLRIWDAGGARRHLRGARLKALVLGDNYAGKSTMLATLRRELGLKAVDFELPFIGMRSARVQGGQLDFLAMDSGLVAQQGKLYAAYTPFMGECGGRVVFVMEGWDYGAEQLGQVADDFSRLMDREVMRGGTVLVLLNMGDARTLSRPWLTSERIEAVLGLHGMGLRHWSVQPCSADTGEGLWQALGWMARVAAVDEK